MEVPITFNFFKKLRLYQDYLKQDAMLEKMKSDYWLLEKAILFWAYSRDHQHIGRPLTISVLTDTERVDRLPKIAEKLAKNSTQLGWVKKYIGDNPATLHTVANLGILGFLTVQKTFEKGDKIGEDTIDEQFLDYPKKFVVNNTGFLLGELLYETFGCPSTLSKNFRKYRLGLLLSRILFLTLLLTTFLLLIEKLGGLLILQQCLQAVTTKILSCFLYDWWTTSLGMLLVYLLARYIWRKL